MKSAFFRFLVVGTLGFVIDSAGTHLLIEEGFSAYLARIPALAISMLVTWLLNRNYTFRSRRPPTGNELGRYLVFAIGMAMINYLTYSLFVSIGLMPLAAIVLATALQVLLSFHGYRTLVFRTGTF